MIQNWIENEINRKQNDFVTKYKFEMKCFRKNLIKCEMNLRPNEITP